MGGDPALDVEGGEEGKDAQDRGDVDVGCFPISAGRGSRP